MTRPNDRPVPVVPFDGHPRPSWMRGRLVVAIERLPQAAYVWDDTDDAVVWDDTDPDRFVWDAPFIGSGYTDTWCDLVDLQIVHGEPTIDDEYRTAYARLTLHDPGDGRYRSRTADGRLEYFATGRRVAVYWLDEIDTPWWLFAGAVATWRDAFTITDTVIEAFGQSGQLGTRTPGRPWTAGANTDMPRTRATKILAALGLSGLRTTGDLGDVPLAVPEAEDVFPINAIRRAYRSDGGIVYDDADDTLTMRDRRWRSGRADQASIPTFTPSVCDLDDAVVLWESEAANIDTRTAGTVALANSADPPLTVTRQTSPYVDPSIVYTHPDPDLWQTQAAGNALGDHLAQVLGDGRMALELGRVYMHDARFDYWHQVLERRVGDLIRFEHQTTWTDPDRVELYDVNLVLTTIRHQITAETWIVEVGTSPAVSYTAVELWDRTSLVWDDPSPLAVWR